MLEKIIGKSADYKQSRAFISLLGGRQWLSVIQRHSFEKVILLLTLIGTKHFSEILILFMALASSCQCNKKSLNWKGQGLWEKNNVDS